MIHMRQIVFKMSQSHVRPFDMKDIHTENLFSSIFIDPKTLYTHSVKV
jgi:hypothetical protein